MCEVGSPSPGQNADCGTCQKTVAVRLEGGLGDHVLGMRVLRFVRIRLPQHKIVVYSDSAGHETPLELAAMSPLVSNAIPVYSKAKDRTVVGRLENVRPQDLALMLAADVFIDAWGGDMFTTAAMTLNVPVFDILASRPQLSVPADAKREVAEILTPFVGASFVGLNLAKYGAPWLRRQEARIARVVSALLKYPNIIVLHMFTSGYEYSHWPEPERTMRRECAREEAEFLKSVLGHNDRVVSCEDLPLCVIAGLITRCCYFIGVDNGIKHLAWALDVPITFCVREVPKLLGQLRWMPDLHRMLPFDAPEALFDSHVAIVCERLSADKAHTTFSE
jgi:hypothetical protein